MQHQKFEQQQIHRIADEELNREINPFAN